jgi:pyridoxamine 5'-phosphate oxidase family protein
MSIFTPEEIEYLESQRMGRLATIGPDGQPHVIPLTYHYNRDEETIDLGGINFDETKKWRDAKRNPRATFLVDDASQTGAHAVEIRGRAELHETGGSTINPRFPNFVEPFIRLRPTHVVSWGVGTPTGMSSRDFVVNSRRVG